MQISILFEMFEKFRLRPKFVKILILVKIVQKNKKVVKFFEISISFTILTRNLDLSKNCGEISIESKFLKKSIFRSRFYKNPEFSQSFTRISISLRIF